MDQGRRDALLLDMCRYITEMRRDMALAVFPLYEFHIRARRPIPEGWPHPSFYRYPADGYPPLSSDSEEEPEETAVAREVRLRAEQAAQRASREEESDPPFVPGPEDQPGDDD